MDSTIREMLKQKLGRASEEGVNIIDHACDQLAGAFENEINNIPVVLRARKTIDEYRPVDDNIIDVEFEKSTSAEESADEK